MSLKNVVASLICMLTLSLVPSTYTNAETNDFSMRTDLEQTLTKFEELFSNERSHYNLNNNDVVTNNLKLSEIYPNNTIDISNDDGSKKLSGNIKKRNDYVSTIKLKDSNKAIALAYIEKRDSKWVIVRVNSYNLLDNEIENYKKTVNVNPTVIIDDANQIYAIGSVDNDDNIEIIETNYKLDLKKGQVEKLTHLKPKLKEKRTIDNQTTTGMASQENNTSNYAYLLIPIILVASVTTFFIRSKHLKNNKNI